MNETLKIVIPMAGLGTRLRPHTWSKPKPLVALAGRTVLDYVLDMFKTVPETAEVEYVFITGLMGEQIKAYMAENYPDLRVSYVVQSEMRGQSDALYLAREHLQGPMIMAFSDTLIETDFSFLSSLSEDGVAWVKAVPDPRRFGVAELNPEGWVTRLIEKPQDCNNDLVVVGFYYFRSGEALVAAIQEQFKRGITLKGEYFLADAINILLEGGMKMHTHAVDVWLDAGTSDAILTTNHYLLEHGHDNSADLPAFPNTLIIPPVHIQPGVKVQDAVIGPYVSLGANCRVLGSIVRESIIDHDTQVTNSLLEGSLLGCSVQVTGQVQHLNIGDHSHSAV